MITKLKVFFNIERRTKYFVHFISLLLIVSVLIFGLLLIGNSSLHKKETLNKKKFVPFSHVVIKAKSAIVWDVINHRELFSKNPDEPLPLASLTKVLTAIMTSEKLNDSQDIKITAEYLKPEGDSKLIIGDTWKMSSLRDFTLLTSSNDGAFALASVAEAATMGQNNDSQAQFVKEMNDLASKIGLSSSRFFNEHGLDRESERGGPAPLESQNIAGGAYGTARDMAILFEYIIKNYPEILEATRYKNLELTSSQKTYKAENTNTALDKIPNIIASKTGYTELAGGNLVVAFDAGLNRPIIVSVLGSSQENRFDDTLKLVSASIKYINDN